MTAPNVSIIIPGYNYGHLIADTLSCLKNQSYTDWEAIIVDDGSTDNTREIVNAFIKEDPRFMYIHQSNSGVSAARNNGLKRVRGKLIQFLDADDLISRDKLNLQVKYLNDHHNVDLVNVNTRYFHTDYPHILYTDLNLSNTSIREEVKGNGLEPILELVEHNPIVVHGPLFRRQVLDSVSALSENMHYLEDWDFWLRIALAGHRFEHLNHPEATALVRAHSLSTSQGTKIQEGEGFLRRRLSSLIKNTTTLTEAQKITAEKLNIRELKNTYKNLMAKTPWTDLKSFLNFYSQMDEPILYFSCLIKSINLKRKQQRSNHQ